MFNINPADYPIGKSVTNLSVLIFVLAISLFCKRDKPCNS